MNANSPRAPVPGLHAGPRRDLLGDPLARVVCACSVVMSAKLQVQVSLKSRPHHDSLWRSGRAAHDRRGVPAQRRRGVRAALLRGPRPDRLRARRLRATAATRGRSCGASPSSSSRSASGSRSTRSARSSRSSRRTARPTGATGRGCRARWSARIDERIAELERLKAGLTECIGCGCLSLDRCKLANPGDRVAARGPGPALLARRPAGAAPVSPPAAGLTS